MAYTTVNDLFTAIANAIRTKKGTSGKISAQDIPTEIASIETGGGSGGDDFEITNIDCLFYRYENSGHTWNNFDEYIKRIKKPTSAKRVYTQGANGASYWYTPLEKIQKLCNLDFSECTSLAYFLGSWGVNNDDAGKTLNVNMNLSNCTALNNAFYSSNLGYSTGNMLNMICDFNGTTGNVTTFQNTFYNMASTQSRLEINNINMDKSGAPNNMFGISSSATTIHALTKLTFKGTFGGLSTTSSITLDLSKCGLFTIDALLETMTSISANVNGKTRIFKLPSALYNELTDEIWDLADEKGYEFAS